MGRASRAKKTRKAEFEAELESRDALLADREAQIAALTERVAQLEEYLHSFLHGRRRRLPDADGQGVLFEHGVEDAASETDAPDESEEADGDDDPPPSPRDGKKKRARRKLDLSSLPTEEIVHELPESDRICPETGALLVPVGEKIIEELHYEPARVIRIRHRYIQYGASAEDAEDRQIKERSAPEIARPIDDCIASAAFLGWLITQKYCHHLPIYRQVSIFEREGLRIPRSTLTDWVLRSSELLEPIADCLLQKVRAGPVMQLDDTPVQCQRGRGEKNFQAYLWTVVNPDVSGVVYRFTAGRSSELIVDLFEEFEGHVVGDGYSGHKAAARIAASRSEKPKHVGMSGCWAHVTRKFKDGACEAEKTATLFRKDIKALYAIDEDAKKQAEERKLSHEEHLALRLQLRRERAPKILLRIYSRARKLRKEERFSDAGKMDKALKYVVNQRAALSRFLADARIPLDNNCCERAIRPLAIGRRNWLFTGSERGGKAAAVIYTLIESCKIAKVNPQAYLADVLVRISTHPASRIEELLPSNWVKLREREALASAA